MKRWRKIHKPGNHGQRNSFVFLFAISLFAFSIIFTACSSPWVNPQKQKQLKKEYSHIYTLKKEMRIDENRSLKKGSKVKVFFRHSSKWIKVYAYPANIERLKALPVLALFILKSDKESGVFEQKKFDEQFNDIFQK